MGEVLLMALQAKHDLTDQRFGRLRVLGKVETSVSPNGTRKSQWLTICDCGNRRVVRGTHLRSGNTLSCGCVAREASRKRARALSLAAKGKPRNRILKPYQWLFNILLKASLKFKEPCDIEYTDFLGYTKTKECTYCGEAIVWPTPYSKSRSTPCGYHLDRKNNDGGYTKANVVVCCPTCNKAKGNRYTFEEWKAMTAALRTLRQGGKHALPVANLAASLPGNPVRNGVPHPVRAPCLQGLL